LKECLHSSQKTQVRVGTVGVRQVVKLDEEVDIARLFIDVAAGRRTERLETPDVVFPDKAL
jgi:hypothetical protein